MNSLIEIDPFLQKVAQQLHAKISRDDDKGMWLPLEFEERTLEWKRNDTNFLIQVYPTIEDDQITGWNFWQAVFEMENDQTFFLQRKHTLRDFGKEMIIQNIEFLFSQSLKELSEYG